LHGQEAFNRNELPRIHRFIIAAANQVEAARCELDQDGVLRIYLRTGTWF
jgi:hypothetical protein